MGATVSSRAEPVQGRVPVGLWRSGWRRLRRDRGGFVSLVAAAAIVLLALFGSATVSRLVGHDGNTPFLFAASAEHRPVRPWTHVPTPKTPTFDAYGNLLTPNKGTKSTLFVFGADGPLGRDELIRLLDGLRTSLEIGIGAMLVALVIAVPIGAAAGYFGGVVDAFVSQFTETVMAFPLLLFLLFANRYLIGDIRSVGWSWVVPQGAIGEAVLIGTFTAFYPIRLIRAQLFVLRNAEFVEAAHMVGTSTWRILRRHLLPHLAPILLVWAGVAIGTNILAEVGLSFLGIGVQVSTPTLGSLLSAVWGTIYNPQTYNSKIYTPWQTIFPMVTIVLTVVSLNRLSEAIRRALEPRAVR
jgi:ABC-type dipeptide/oligopeptide/nickel transport system permease subunit